MRMTKLTALMALTTILTACDRAEKADGTLVKEKRVYSPDIYFAESRATNPVVCRFSTEEVPPGWLIAFRARPMTVFGVRGASIETPFEKRVWKAPKQPGKGGAAEKKL